MPRPWPGVSASGLGGHGQAVCQAHVTRDCSLGWHHTNTLWPAVSGPVPNKRDPGISCWKAGKQAPKTALLGIPSLPGLASSQHTDGSNPDLTQSVPCSASGPGSWLTCSSCWPGSWATGHLSHTGCSGRPLICGCGPPPAACWVGRRSEATRPVRLACHPLTCS